MDLGLSGKRVLITGGSGGIGRAVAAEFAAHGARLALSYLGDASPAKALAAELPPGADGLLLEADVRDAVAVARMFEALDQRWEGIDILVNNAGIDGRRAASWDMPVDDWLRVIDVNLKGAFLCAREALRRMVPARSGVVVNTTSVHEIIPWGGYSAYAASKAGLSMLAKTMAQETAPYGVRVLNVAPGAVKTAINANVWSDEASFKDLLDKIPMRRMGSPEEVAKIIAVVSSDVGSYLTGSTVYVDGAMSTYPSFAHGG